MQITLKDLFVFVAFCAVVAWCGSLTGFSETFLVAVALMAIIGWIFIRGTTKKPTSLGVCITLFVMAIMTFLIGFFSTGFLAYAFMLLIASWVLNSLPAASLRRSTYVAFACAAVALVLGMMPGISKIRKVRQLREEYPIVSLRERLPNNLVAYVSEVDLSTTTQSVREELDSFEEILRQNDIRSMPLQRLHWEQTEQFVAAIGFGVSRMEPGWWLRRLERPLPPLENITFDAAPLLKTQLISAGWFENYSDDSGRTYGKPPPPPEVFLHRFGRLDFLHPDGFGGVLDAEPRVAGFVPHAFHHPPTSGLPGPTAITIDRLELVSLLKFAEPRVYVLDHLPRMDQLSGDDVPTRPLDEFETAALEKLWTEQDIVTEQHDGRVRMLGSLRAAKQCLDCHSVERGTLLGASTYVIRQNKPAVPVGE